MDRIIMYTGHAVCMVLALIWPPGGLWVIGVVSVVMIVRIFTAKE